MNKVSRVPRLVQIALMSLIALESGPANTNPNRERISLPLNCETLLNGQPYRYIRDPQWGLKYETCEMVDGEPILHTNYKDRGFSVNGRFRVP